IEDGSSNDFEKFIHTFRAAKIMDLLANYDIDKKDLRNYISGIDFSVLSWKWKLYRKMSFFMKKYIASFYNR
ncbi:MAG TPA: hypothetical protein PKC47_02210, partial [Petrimonas sp.]|nr:hypothetical protein [Petrimonas sp.]